MKVIKKILAAMAFALLASAFAQHNYSISPVYDGANLLTDEEFASLNQQISEIVEKHSQTIGLYIALVPSMEEYGYYDATKFSEFWYKQNDLGIGESRNGLLFILSMENRDYDICAHGNLAHTAFTDYGKSKLADTALVYLRNNNWHGAFSAFINKCDHYLYEAENGTPYDIGSESYDDEYYEEDPDAFGKSLLFALAAGLVIALIVVFVMKGKLNNVHAATQADNYIDNSKIKISYRSDKFTHTTVVSVPRESSSSSGGTSVNSGGFSHSSGKF